jgi:hypothetical protein
VVSLLSTMAPYRCHRRLCGLGQFASLTHFMPRTPSPQGLCFVLFVTCSAGCSSELEPLYDAGDPCRTITTFCVDVDVMMACLDGVWSEQDCSDFCEGQASGVESTGCESVTQWEGSCACVPPLNGCTPGETICESDDTLNYCGDDWQWSTASCAEICAAHPPNTTSLGCMVQEESQSEACLCTAAGSPCTSENSACVDDHTLAMCENGTWSHVDCGEFCGGEANACVPSVQSGASCECG